MAEDQKLIDSIKNINLSNLQLEKHPLLPDIASLAKSTSQETYLDIDKNKLQAVCSLWWENSPTYQNYKTAVLGHFFADNSTSGQDLIQHCLKLLAERGFEYVVGPMDGSTWHSYRLVTDYGNHSPFFLEYYTPKEWSRIFQSAGFESIAKYSSAITRDLGYRDRSSEKFAAKISQLGLGIRPFNLEASEKELTAIHELSLKSFAKNFLYTDISRSDFLALYEKVMPYVDPDFALLAEDDGQLVGFVFAIPDYLQKQRGEVIDTVIIKTVAKIPNRRYAGLGNYLVFEMHKRAAQRGFKQVIHALMHDSNASRAISNKSAYKIREYTLYGKLLNSKG